MTVLSPLTFHLLALSLSPAGKMLMTDLLKADEIKKALEAFAGQWKRINGQIGFKHTGSEDRNHELAPQTHLFYNLSSNQLRHGWRSQPPLNFLFLR